VKAGIEECEMKAAETNSTTAKLRNSSTAIAHHRRSLQTSIPLTTISV